MISKYIGDEASPPTPVNPNLLKAELGSLLSVKTTALLVIGSDCWGLYISNPGICEAGSLGL